MYIYTYIYVYIYFISIHVSIHVCHDLPITSSRPRRNGDDIMPSILVPTESIVKPKESMEWNDEDTEEVMNTYKGNENLEEGYIKFIDTAVKLNVTQKSSIY